jgi:DNA-binding NarL/FixJ family response regulator
MRIIVASDNKSTRDAIAMLIRVQSDLELAGEADDIADLLAQIKATKSPLVVFDWDALGQRIDTLMDLLQLFEKPPAIVALSVHENARADALSAGIPSFAHKGEPPDRLLATIRESERSKPAKSERPNGKPF